MNKILKGALTAACAFFTVFGGVACAADSAYDIAVKNGFKGTEKEWLASLKGQDGDDGSSLDIDAIYEKAKENGYEGDYLTFLKEYLSVDLREDNDTVQIAENIMSVVSIYCGFSKKTGGGFMGMGMSETKYYTISGSGVIIDLDKETGDALIVTNYHVLYDDASSARGISDCIYLYTYGALNRFSPKTGDQGGDGLEATYIGGAMDYDIALLKVEGSEYLKTSAACEAKIGSSDEIIVGEKVYAIGSPDGAGISLTSGAISVESEYIAMTSTDGKAYVSYRVMRTDAAINGGNSGGALFNAKGELIGITNAKSTGEETDNMGFALPITQVTYLCDNIRDNLSQSVKAAVLGATVEVKSSKASFDENGHVKITESLHITEKASLSQADYGLFEVFDVLEWMQINDGEVHYLTRKYQLDDLLLTVRKGDRVTFGVKRDGGTSLEVVVNFSNNSHFRTYR